MVHHALNDHGREPDGRHRGDGGRNEHPERGQARPVTFDQFDLTTYLHADNHADGSFSERFILRANGFELNGAPIDVPGLGSKFGMYFVIDATGQQTGAVTTFSTLKIALMVDPGNNNGAISAAPGGIGFANGTRGDYALATGTFVSASLQRDSTTTPATRHASFVEQVTPTQDGREVFGKSLVAGDQLRELLTTVESNPPFSFIPNPPAVGGGVTLVNAGIGTAQLVSGHALRLSLDELVAYHGHAGG